jgi:hypothetical protein
MCEVNAHAGDSRVLLRPVYGCCQVVGLPATPVALSACTTITLTGRPLESPGTLTPLNAERTTRDRQRVPSRQRTSHQRARPLASAAIAI